MNFMSSRAGFCEEHQITGSRGMSSSSSSSLHHFTSYHQQDGGPAAAQLQDYSPSNNGGGGEDTVEDSEDHIFGRRSGVEGSSTGHQVVIEREHMFDKVVTPSDVGKLNRLVIPKQHAEKYFPLDSSTNEKGLLLNFEDRNGKPWRFRYSYWNSSQSYVMTKGWSRFVKEKKLEAGDIVSFQRGMGELGKDRLFIDWRRRPDAPEFPSPIPTLSIPHQFSFHRSIHPWNPLFLQPPPSREYSHLLQANASMTTHHHYPTGSFSPYASYNTSVVNGNPCPPGSILYLRSASGAAGGGGGGAGGAGGGVVVAGAGAGAGVGVFAPQQVQVGMMHTQRGSGAEEQMVFESVPVVQGKAAAKRLRLFGVNMDCPISDSDECDILSHSHSTMPLHQLPHPPFHSSSSSSAIPSLQLRPYNQNDDKGKGSMSLDLDI